MRVVLQRLRGVPVYYAVWYDGGENPKKKLFRFPLEADAGERAQIRAEALAYAQAHDTRVHPDQTFAGFLNYYAAHMPKTMPAESQANDRPAVKRAAKLAPDVKLINLDTTHVEQLYHALLKANLELPKEDCLSRTTLHNNLKAVQRGLKKSRRGRPPGQQSVCGLVRGRQEVQTRSQPSRSRAVHTISQGRTASGYPGSRISAPSHNGGPEWPGSCLPDLGQGAFRG